MEELRQPLEVLLSIILPCAVTTKGFLHSLLLPPQVSHDLVGTHLRRTIALGLQSCTDELHLLTMLRGEGGSGQDQPAKQVAHLYVRLLAIWQPKTQAQQTSCDAHLNPLLNKVSHNTILMYQCNQALPPLLSCSAGQLLSYGRPYRVDPSVCAYLPSWSRPCMQSTSQGGTWSLWGTSPHLPDDSLLCTQITHSPGYLLVSQLLPLSPVPSQPVSSC